MRAIGSVCRMNYICPKSSDLKAFVQQFTSTLRSKIQENQSNRSVRLGGVAVLTLEAVTFLNF